MVRSDVGFLSYLKVHREIVTSECTGVIFVRIVIINIAESICTVCKLKALTEY